MAPRNVDTVHFADNARLKDELQPVVTPETHADTAKRPPREIVWRNVFWLGYLHAFALYGLYMLPWASPRTWLWSELLSFVNKILLYLCHHTPNKRI